MQIEPPAGITAVSVWLMQAFQPRGFQDRLLCACAIPLIVKTAQMFCMRDISPAQGRISQSVYVQQKANPLQTATTTAMHFQNDQCTEAMNFQSDQCTEAPRERCDLADCLECLIIHIGTALQAQTCQMLQAYKLTQPLAGDLQTNH